MITVPVRNAVGMTLGHDITRIIPGEFKGAAFKKGHIITTEDIDELLKIGKEHIFVLELGSGIIHENDAALRIAQAACGQGTVFSQPAEGKVEFHADYSGLLKINTQALLEINLHEGIIFSTAHSDHVAEKSQKLGGTRIIPLVIEEAKIKEIETICGNCFPLIQIKPLKKHNVGIVTTGNEIYHGRIADKFGPVLKRKFEALGSNIMKQVMVNDDTDRIADAITGLIRDGADFVATTGGMSVDPDDVTPSGIKAAGGSIISYGAPVLPGAMFLLAMINDVPVVGLPGCVMYVSTSIFELVVPRILAGETVSRKEIAMLGHGGFCYSCHECRYPKCSFGKGSN